MSSKGVSRLGLMTYSSFGTNDTDYASADDNLDSVDFEMAGGSVYNTSIMA